MDDLADKLGIDPLEMRLKNLPEDDFRTPVYQAEVKMGAELIGWQRPQAARPERQGADQARARHGPAPVGRRRRAGQAGHLHDQPRRLGRGEDAPPRTSAPAPGPILAIIAAEVLGLKSTDITVEHRQLDLPARPGLGRLDDHPVDEPAVLRRGQPGPRRALRQDRPRR